MVVPHQWLVAISLLRPLASAYGMPTAWFQISRTLYYPLSIEPDKRINRTHSPSQKLHSLLRKLEHKIEDPVPMHEKCFSCQHNYTRTKGSLSRVGKVNAHMAWFWRSPQQSLEKTILVIHVCPSFQIS